MHPVNFGCACTCITANTFLDAPAWQLGDRKAARRKCQHGHIGGSVTKIPMGCADFPTSPWLFQVRLSASWEEGYKQVAQLFPTIKLQSFQTPQMVLLQAYGLHFCNSSSREKELGGLTLLDDSCLSCCQITGTTSQSRSRDQARLLDSAIPEKKPCL